MDDSEGRVEITLLTIVIDVTPAKKFASKKLEKSQDVPLLNKIFDAVIAFGNSHLMQSNHNQLAILACNSQTTKFLHPPEEGASKSHRTRAGQYELFAKVDAEVRQGLSNLILSDKTEHNSSKSDSLLGGGMARALCYIHHIKRGLPMNSQLIPRILVISGSSDSALQYMTFMNVFFTAQKENIVIDCCMMDADSGLLQQGCDITGGQYLRIPNNLGLLEYLLWVFLPSPSCRSKLALPPPTKVDYRAACFCHRQLVDIGYVCSVCLSIFCKFSPVCTTCNTVFSKNSAAGQGLAAKAKKKLRTKMD